MRSSRLWLCLVIVLLLGAMAAKNLLVRAPPLRTANGPGEFNAQRAAQRLAVILGDERPHPTDSIASDGVRDRLIGQLRDLGLQPVVRDEFACNELYKSRGVSCARVRNIVAVMGPRTGKALLLNAHYDSSPVGPGAGDDGIGVATLLEVAASLQNDRLRRPVILLFNEGEELGLIGARAFLSDPLAASVDSLVNLEARGVRGPVNMFETSRPNGAAIAVFKRAATNPVANSLSTDVYRLMPNYTDVNSFAERGWTTLNLAPIGNETRYHSAGDNLAALDRATLQHMGDQTLALARKMTLGIPPPSGDRIFMDVAGRWLMTMPLVAGMILLAGLLVGSLVLVVRRGGQLRSAAVVLGTLVMATGLAWVALALVGAARGGMFWRAYPQWTHLAIYATVTLAGVFALATIGRSLSVGQLRAMTWFAFLIVGSVIAIFAPGGIVYFLAPPLLALASVVAARWWPAAERWGAWLAVLALYLTWGAMLGLLEELLNSGPIWVFAPLGALWILPVLVEAKPLIDKTTLRFAIGAATIPALLGFAASAAFPAYSADRQQRFTIEHLTDATAGKARWSVLNGGDPLTDGYEPLGEWKREKLPFAEQRRWLADGPPLMGIPAPELTVLSSTRNGRQRTLTMRLSAKGAERVAIVAADDAQIRAAGSGGFVRPISPEATNGRYLLSCTGRACEGVDLTIVTAHGGPIDVTLVGSRSGLPLQAKPLLEARPRFARPQYTPDQTVVFSKAKI